MVSLAASACCLSQASRLSMMVFFSASVRSPYCPSCIRQPEASQRGVDQEPVRFSSSEGFKPICGARKRRFHSASLAAARPGLAIPLASSERSISISFQRSDLDASPAAARMPLSLSAIQVSIRAYPASSLSRKDATVRLTSFQRSVCAATSLLAPSRAPLDAPRRRTMSSPDLTTAFMNAWRFSASDSADAVLPRLFA